MLSGSSIFHGLRLHRPHLVFPPRAVGIRTIFYPAGPIPPSPPEGTDGRPAETSMPHVSRAVWQGIPSGFENLISDEDLKTRRSSSASSLETNVRIWQNVVGGKAPGPYEGRSVNIRHDIPITRAWDILNAILNINNVRRELRRTARHEQKGEKRRRLISERWRRRFAHEVRMKVKLVQEMRSRDRMWGARH